MINLNRFFQKSLIALSLIVTVNAHAAIPVVEMEVTPDAVSTTATDASYVTGADWPEGYIAITFDDGPHPVHTLRVLDILRRYGVRATFFIVGEMAAMHPEALRETLKEGHTIGTHSYSHPNIGNMTVPAALAEIQHGIDAVKKALGEDPAPFFRFPFLSSSPAIRLATAKKGLAEIGWNSLSLTTNLAPMDGHKKRGILITHDLQPSAEQYLPGLLDQMEKYGYTAVVLVPKKH